MPFIIGKVPIYPSRKGFFVEFVFYSLCAASLFFVLLKPHKEKLAFGLLVASFAMSVLMFFMASATSIVPAVNL
ncbi:hypothetical protein FRC0484_00945 [Corynebacterium diphtheriae]|nr:hypothetical protein CIP107566_02058 [Corynebacterium diphtheriae]CAB0918010.1 hypothetical protein FRC0411_02130 [Corynebacterium diphtheriae]CAB0925142.1 hypothetical protein FRC0431_02070 [Corynebacterium diphtheriae]CAB0961687.1 hypothetical protein FRC0484_00945 [Corynebacterium diphtheriae]CAB0967224.1 hypothetical protein FRC0478_01866 [Corynebacterium diphtheriae]